MGTTFDPVVRIPLEGLGGLVVTAKPAMGKGPYSTFGCEDAYAPLMNSNEGEPRTCLLPECKVN